MKFFVHKCRNISGIIDLEYSPERVTDLEQKLTGFKFLSQKPVSMATVRNQEILDPEAISAESRTVQHQVCDSSEILALYKPKSC